MSEVKLKYVFKGIVDDKLKTLDENFIATTYAPSKGKAFTNILTQAKFKHGLRMSDKVLLTGEFYIFYSTGVCEIYNININQFELKTTNLEELIKGTYESLENHKVKVLKTGEIMRMEQYKEQFLNKHKAKIRYILVKTDNTQEDITDKMSFFYDGIMLGDDIYSFDKNENAYIYKENKIIRTI